MRRFAVFLTLLLLPTSSCMAADPPAAAPASQPADGKLPHVQVDVKKKQVRIECESCNENMDVGLEFFCVATGTNEYESVLRSKAKASHIHLGLLMIGAQPGEPVKYSEAARKWIAPHGPPLQITCEWKKGNEVVSAPAYRLMRNLKTKKEAPPFTWVFTGSKVMDDGKYAADVVGYLVSILNNELTVIDVPEIAGRDLESREWERNAALLPAAGTTIWMVIEPAGKNEGKPAEKSPKVEAPVVDAGSTLVSLDAAGKVQVDGMSVPVERLTEALANRRLQTKVQLAVATGAPPEEVKKVTDAIQSAHVELALAQPAPPANTGAAANGISDVTVDPAKIKALKAKWERAVAPHGTALREAAQAHYEVIEAMRREQQRLIDEADRIQRAIDELTKQYQDMTTPRPEPLSP